MSKKGKVILSIFVILATIWITNNIYAMETPQRTLVTPEVLYTNGKLVEGASTMLGVGLNPTEQGYWNTLTSGGTVNLGKTQVENFSNLLCIASNKYLPSSANYRISGTENIQRNNAIAYILSEPRRNDEIGTDLYNQTIQGALWLTGLNDSLSDYIQNGAKTDAAQALYQVALAYENYRSEYSNPRAITNNARTDANRVIGPFKIEYVRRTVTTGGQKYSFGEIKGAQLTDTNGNVINSSDWMITDKNGNKLTNENGTYNYPLPNQEFYIKISKNLNISKVKLQLEFNNLSAEGRYIVLTGKYDTAGSSGVALCSDCKKALSTNRATGDCGAYIYPNTYRGCRIASTTTLSRYCNKAPKIITGEGHEIYGSATKARVTVDTTVKIDLLGRETKSNPKTYACGETYTVSVTDMRARRHSIKA
jgi:hypothetical protein